MSVLKLKHSLQSCIDINGMICFNFGKFLSTVTYQKCYFYKVRTLIQAAKENMGDTNIQNAAS